MASAPDSEEHIVVNVVAGDVLTVSSEDAVCPLDSIEEQENIVMLQENDDCIFEEDSIVEDASIIEEGSMDVGTDTLSLQIEGEEEEEGGKNGGSSSVDFADLLEPVSACEVLTEDGHVTSKAAIRIFKGMVPAGGLAPSKLMQKINFTCDICGLVLKGYTSLNSHRRTVHAKIKRRVCDVCGWKFSARSQLRSHKTAVHIRKCENCQEYVNEVGPWPEGVTRNTPREVLCANCNQVVLFQSGTARYSKTKAIIKDNPASPQKVFIHPDEAVEVDSALSTMQSTEEPSTSEEASTFKERKFKPRVNNTKYVCQECGKLFEAPSEVKKHMIIHSKKRNFMCDLCGAKLKSKLTLDSHIKLHDPTLGFTCPLCEKFYRNKDNLQRHLLTKHGVSIKLADIKLNQPLQIEVQQLEVVPVVSEYEINLMNKDFTVIEDGPVTMTEHEVQSLTE